MQSADMIKVSVITYVKNTVSYIEECIRSIMNQTLQEIEILVVDGGSIDGTLEIISELQKEDERIRLLHAPASVGAQFNLGLSEAKGEYIAVCEADDHILPEMLEKEYMVAHENRLDVLRADYYRFCNVFGEEKRFYTKGCLLKKGFSRVIDSSKDDLFLKQGNRGFWSGIYRRSFLVDNNVYMNETAGASYQDITFSFLTQMLAKRIYFMDEAFYCYRIDNPNASVNSKKCIQMHIAEYRYLADQLKERGLWEDYKSEYYAWELGAYSYFINQLSNDVRKKEIKTIYQNLKEQNEKEHYELEDMSEYLQKIARSLVKGEEYFADELQSKSLDYDRMVNYFSEKFIDDDNMVIFGVGHMGRIVQCFLELLKKQFYLTDNNKKLQIEGVVGRKVYAPEKIVELSPSSTYIIANLCNARDMSEQLKKLGVGNDKMIMCCDEETFLRRILVGFHEKASDDLGCVSKI